MFVASTYQLHSQWVETNGLTDNWVFAFGFSGTNLFADISPNNGSFENIVPGVFLSTNNGSSWSAANTPFLGFLGMAEIGTNLFAATEKGVFLSTNNGSNWAAVNTGLPDTAVTALAVSGTNLFAGTATGGVFLSTNNGTNWTVVDTGLTWIWALATSGTNVFVDTWQGVHRSTNNGSSWTSVNTGLSNKYVSSLAVEGTNIFAGTANDVFLSTNNGASWNDVDTSLSTSVSSLAVSGANIFAGTGYGSLVSVSTNNGASWTTVDAGLTLPNTAVFALFISGTNLFAGTTFGVWRRPLSEMITSVKGRDTEKPTRFSLSQNYPNPFNPTTTISFTLPSRSIVSLKVFDMLGREVSMIVSGELQAGNYNRQWNAANMASGVYFYSLQAGTNTETKNLLLLK